MCQSLISHVASTSLPTITSKRLNKTHTRWFSWELSTLWQLWDTLWALESSRRMLESKKTYYSSEWNGSIIEKAWKTPLQMVYSTWLSQRKNRLLWPSWVVSLNSRLWSWQSHWNSFIGHHVTEKWAISNQNSHFLKFEYGSFSAKLCKTARKCSSCSSFVSK